MSSGFNGFEMDCLATLAVMENNKRLCAKRWPELDEQVVLCTVRDEWQRGDRVLKGSLLKQSRGQK